MVQVQASADTKTGTVRPKALEERLAAMDPDALRATFASYDDDGVLVIDGVPVEVGSGGGSVLGVFNANAAPYNCTPGDPTHDNSAALQQVINDALTWTQTGTNPGSVVIELDDGEYYLTRAVQAVDGCYAQVPITPRVPIAGKRANLTIRSKQGSRPIARPFFNNGRVGVVFRSTLTGQTWSNTNGWPAMFGSADRQTAGDLQFFRSVTSWINLHFQGITFRQPENPSLCAVNAYLVDSRVFEDCMWDTTGMGADAYYAVKPTHPTGICEIAPFNNLDGNDWKGLNFASGHFAGPAVGELMSNHGTIYSYENYVAYNVQEPYYHAADLGFFFDVRCCFGFANVDPVYGVGPILPGLPMTGRTHITGHYDIEDGTNSWKGRIKHILDPNNNLGGKLEYFRVVAAAGGTSGPLNVTGAENITLVDLAALPAQPTYVLNHSFTGADSTSTAGPADSGQAETQASGAWGRISNQAYRVSGTGLGLDLWQTGLADGTFEVRMTHTENNGDGVFVFRATDADNALFVDFYRDSSGSSVNGYLTKRISGTNTLLSSAVPIVPLPAGISYNLKAVCLGNNIKVYVDNVLKFEFTGTTGQEAATKAGIGTAGAASTIRFDALRARA